ncbi:MAG: putative toxin-antitoxin system toxin component, PIN family [Candidatus Aminicenantes bacterium RBG_19FT_COMBO_58_17]|nr:MAG: putative toxin-antitoxin system toxin component, PIN family [Candidatus Aminicenantes bacterium RBG_19FT_COMBO_58_17]HCS48494.1 putative toxin-antitoxin system toxin component, PIN family [Candidatus Aminicenantes bacterium]
MGEERLKDKTPPRVVLDTNVIISALLFRGLPSRLIPLWQKGKMTLLVSSQVLKEYLRVLAYPRFELAAQEIKSIIEVELLPFVEAVRVESKIRVIAKDPSDDKFLELAVDGKADFLISHDKHLLGLGVFRGTQILSVAEFLRPDRSILR